VGLDQIHVVADQQTQPKHRNDHIEDHFNHVGFVVVILNHFRLLTQSPEPKVKPYKENECNHSRIIDHFIPY
jgi:hypothetical protein